jgi:uncharacterized repeat protein (TIGR01451 family)
MARSATPSAAGSYFRAAGAAVVKQIGTRNYAGPNCPGAGWNCTTSTLVFQATSPGGQNVADCTMGVVISGSNTSCDITQTGSTNVARCTQRSSDPAANQRCTITQTGASNTATIAQAISQSAGATQNGTQTANVTQGPAVSPSTVFNVLRATQSVSQNLKGGGTQVQNAHQKILVSQTATGSGYNQSDLNQSQLQKAAAAVSQSQNATEDPVADCLAGDPSAPNACSDVTQHSASGTNYNALNQSINQDANTAASNATQNQGSPGGGLEGHVHQDTVSGSSQNKAKQNKQQMANAGANADQTQYDPVRCCGTFSLVGPGVEDINQSSSIGASSPDASQHSTLIGESRTPDGTCKVNQHAAVDGGSANNSETLTPCPYLVLTTECSSGSTDAPTRGDNCTASEPDLGVDSVLDKQVRNGDGSYADTTTAATGDTVEFQIQWNNTGPSDVANGVTVTDVVPDGLTYVADSCSVEPNPCTYNADTKTITWNLGTVPGHESPPLTFEAVVISEDTETPITNTANASTNQEGAGAASDSATVVVDNSVIEIG